MTQHCCYQQVFPYIYCSWLIMCYCYLNLEKMFSALFALSLYKRVLFIYLFGLFFGTNVIKINNWSWFSQITSLPVILWYLSPISQDVQYHLRSRSKTGNTMFLRQYLGMNDMYFFQPLLITCIYRPHMVDIDKITNNFTFLYFRKKFMTYRRFTPGGRTA